MKTFKCLTPEQSYRAFFDGGISKHQAQINQNEAQVFLFTFRILKLQLHFVGSVNREVWTTINYPTLTSNAQVTRILLLVQIKIFEVQAAGTHELISGPVFIIDLQQSHYKKATTQVFCGESATIQSLPEHPGCVLCPEEGKIGTRSTSDSNFYKPLCSYRTVCRPV